MAMVSIDSGSLQADSQPKPLACSEGRQLLGVVLHSSNYGELSQWLCHDNSAINISMHYCQLLSSLLQGDLCWKWQLCACLCFEQTDPPPLTAFETLFDLWGTISIIIYAGSACLLISLLVVIVIYAVYRKYVQCAWCRTK